jgi:class 3 adenylate cyclase/pimeloyl-ACP methyl ester carboxylesterase
VRTEGPGQPETGERRAGSLATMTGPAEVRYARSGDIDIAYTVLGEGPPDLVYVPGFVSHLDLCWDIPPFAGIMRALSQMGRLITFDKRGTGLSDRSLGFGSFEERMDDIRAVMDAAAVDRARFFCVSEGGPLALLFAASHPDRIDRLAMYGSLGARGYWSPDYRPGVPADVAQRFLEVVEATWGTGRALPYFIQHAPTSDEMVRTLARYERNACTPKMAVEIVRRNLELDIRSLLPTAAVPTLVLHCRDDPLLRIGHARYYAEHLPHARLVAGDGDFHVSWRAAEMDWVLEAAREFLIDDEAAPPPPPSTSSPARAGRVLATVLFTDIVGSTEQAARLGDRAWRDVLDDHDRLSSEAVHRHGGRVVKTTGDGLLATFDGPSPAIAGARELATAMAERGFAVRAGIHSGEVERRGDDVGGLGVHIAARVAGLAGASEVWVSRTVRDLVTGSGVVLEPQGVHELKGVPEPWELFRVAG